jgi:hypothetical protein
MNAGLVKSSGVRGFLGVRDSVGSLILKTGPLSTVIYYLLLPSLSLSLLRIISMRGPWSLG